MLITKPGCIKKVQFCAAMAALATVMTTTAMAASVKELHLPIAQMQQELARKAEAVMDRKLRQCEEAEPGKVNERSRPRYPTRIAERKGGGGGIAKAQLRVI